MRSKRMALAVMAGALTWLVPAQAAAAPPKTLTINSLTQVEGTGGTTAFNFTVTLSGTSTQTVTVNYSTANGTAIAPGDYASASGQLSFPPGSLTQQITVNVVGDALNETNETFTVRLKQAKNAKIAGGGTGTGTITNDDAQPTVSINDVSVTEGNTGSINAVFTVTLSAASGQTVTMNYATAGGTATAGADYVGSAGSLSFPAGTLTQNISVPVFGDLLDELDETFNVNLSNLVNANPTGSDTQGVGTITDDDPQPSLSIDDVVTVEGNAGSANAVFTVTLSTASGRTVTVDYTTTNGTASAGSDYQTTASTATFNPGITTQTISVPIFGDTGAEPNETYTVDLFDAVGATIADSQGNGTIVDDDGTPAASIDDVTAFEGTGGTTTFAFTVTLAPTSGNTVTVDYATADGTATSASDYTAAPTTTLTFNTGESTKTVSIDVNPDTANEPDETFFVNLTNVTGGANLGRSQGTGSIQNDDALPTVSVSDVSQTEGDSGSADFVFTVTLSAASGQTVTMNYATADGTTDPASGGSDYTAVAGALSFPPGTSSLDVHVPVAGDILNEADETFFLNVSNLGNADPVGSDLQGLGTIQNDDPQPSLTISDATEVELDDVPGPVMTFTVSLSPASGQTVTVDYATQDGTATVADSDYTQITSTPLTFAPGVSSQTVTVSVNGDTTPEPNETMTVELSGATNATIGDASGLGSILNDDGLTVEIDDVIVTEGNGGTVNASFPVSLSEVSGSDVTVDFVKVDGSAASGLDYVGGTGSVTITAGNLSNTVIVLVNGDTLPEADETFFVNLSNATGGATILDNQGQGTITDDDPLPGITIDNTSLPEGNSGLTPFTFTVSLPPTGQPVSVSYATADGTADGGNDYQAAAGTLNFPASNGTQTQSVIVQVIGETVGEPDETFVVILSGAVNANIADGTGIGTITDDDLPPTLSINAASVVEGNSGSANAVFTVTLSAVSGQSVTVKYATADGTALRGTDYTAGSGTVTFAPGQLSQNISVAVLGDTLYEGTETFLVNLFDPVNSNLSDAHGQGAITDDDAMPTLTIDQNVNVGEGNSGTVNAVFTVRLSTASGTTTTVAYATADGNAKAPGDYTATSGSLSLPAGTTSRTLIVPVLGDTLDENNEAFVVKLSAPGGATLGRSSGQGTILDNDGRPSLCTPIVSVPFTITIQGAYCLVQNLSTNVAQGAAIRIDTDFVALDMKGFKLGGGGAGLATQTSGIYALDRKNITVKNGNVRGFFRAVFLDDSSDDFTTSQGHLIQGLRLDENTLAGIWVEGRGNVLRGNQVVSTGATTVFGADTDAYGIVSRGPGARVINNDASGSVGAGAGSGFGILLLSADGSVVERNRVSNATLGASASFGIYASSGGDVVISNNRVSTMDFGVFYGSGTGKYRDNLTSGVTTPFSGGIDAGNNN